MSDFDQIGVLVRFESGLAYALATATPFQAPPKKQKRAKCTFDYEPTNEDELALKVDLSIQGI